VLALTLDRGEPIAKLWVDTTTIFNIFSKILAFHLNKRDDAIEP
jgi:hypothetical protein